MQKVVEGRAPEDHNERYTVLVVDDEPGFHASVAPYLEKYRRLAAYNTVQAMQKLSKNHVDVVLLDLNLPDRSGMDIIPLIKAERDDVEIIMITGDSQLTHCVEAVKRGAFDFLPKTLESFEQVELRVERALEQRRRKRQDILARAEQQGMRDALELLEKTTSQGMAGVVGVLRKVAPTRLTVLIEGESGVGKELLARMVHLHSPRADKPFVAVNLAAIPANLAESKLFGHVRGAYTGATETRQGSFAVADGGTIFLDEIGELDLPMQAKLLRALQERVVDRVGADEPEPVDVRVLAATNRDLEAEVVAGRFREDLFYRLNVVRVTVPPLRERTDDIPALVKLFVAREARELKLRPPQFTQEAIKVLQGYGWPGNVRELENLVKRFCALNAGEKISDADIPVEYCLEHLGKIAAWKAEQDASAESLYELARRQFEEFLVRRMVKNCGGNMAEAARRLGVSYSTVKNKMAGAYELED